MIVSMSDVEKVFKNVFTSGGVVIGDSPDGKVRVGVLVDTDRVQVEDHLVEMLKAATSAPSVTDNTPTSKADDLIS